MIYIIILLLFIGYIVSPSGYDLNSPWWTHITYIFSHINLLHLFLNSFVIFGLFKTLQRIYNKWHLSLWVFFIAILMSFLSEYELPTVGASGMAYALVGIMIGLVVKKQLIFAKRINLYIFSIGITIGVIVSYFKGTSNIALHLLCLVSGFLVSLSHLIKKRP